MSNVKIVRLLNGDEIIGDISTLDTQQLLIKSPAQIQIVGDEGGRMQMGLVPYLFLAKDQKEDVKISDFAIVTVYTPNDEVLNSYNKSFGNGIITQTSQLIV